MSRQMIQLTNSVLVSFVLTPCLLTGLKDGEMAEPKPNVGSVRRWLASLREEVSEVFESSTARLQTTSRSPPIARSWSWTRPRSTLSSHHRGRRPCGMRLLSCGQPRSSSRSGMRASRQSSPRRSMRLLQWWTGCLESFVDWTRRCDAALGELGG